MKTVNLVPLLQKFSRGWVAVSVDYKKVIATGRTLRSVSEKVKEEGSPKVILMPVARNYRGYVTQGK